jgi:hypothetical protein
MAKVRLLQGKPLMVGGKVALSDDCCCGGAVCPPDGVDLTVTFSGIETCLCSSFLGSSFKVTSGDPNGTYLIPFDSPGFWQSSGIGTFHFLTYVGVTDCTTIPIESDVSAFIQVGCTDGEWTVFFFLEGSARWFGGDSFSLPVPNDNTCNDESFGNPLIGELGTAAISW